MTAPEGTIDDAPPHSPELQKFFALLRSRGPTLNLLYEHARASQERDEDAIVRDAFARAIVEVIYSMLRDFWSVAGASKRDWKRAEPRFGDCSLGQMLAGALGIGTKKGGKHTVMRGAVCWSVLQSITDGAGYNELDGFVRETAAYLECGRKL